MRKKQTQYIIMSNPSGYHLYFKIDKDYYYCRFPHSMKFHKTNIQKIICGNNSVCTADFIRNIWPKVKNKQYDNFSIVSALPIYAPLKNKNLINIKKFLNLFNEIYPNELNEISIFILINKHLDMINKSNHNIPAIPYVGGAQ